MISGFKLPIWQEAQEPSPGASLKLKPRVELAFKLNKPTQEMAKAKKIPVIFFITGIDHFFFKMVVSNYLRVLLTSTSS